MAAKSLSPFCQPKEHFESWAPDTVRSYDASGQANVGVSFQRGKYPSQFL